MSIAMAAGYFCCWRTAVLVDYLLESWSHPMNRSKPSQKLFSCGSPCYPRIALEAKERRGLPRSSRMTVCQRERPCTQYFLMPPFFCAHFTYFKLCGDGSGMQIMASRKITARAFTLTWRGWYMPQALVQLWKLSTVLSLTHLLSGIFCGVMYLSQKSGWYNNRFSFSRTNL